MQKNPEVQQPTVGKDPLGKAKPDNIIEDKEGNDLEDNPEGNSDSESTDSSDTVRDVSGSPGRLSEVELEEELPDASGVTGNPSEVPEEGLLGVASENNKDPLVKDKADGETGPPPEVTPSKVPDKTKSNDPDKPTHDKNENGKANESNQESLKQPMEVESDFIKPPETNLMANPPAIGSVPTDDSPEILRTPRRSTPSPRNEELDDESLTDGTSEKLKEIQLMAN